jgi:hypothetical protein
METRADLLADADGAFWRFLDENLIKIDRLRLTDRHWL